VGARRSVGVRERRFAVLIPTSSSLRSRPAGRGRSSFPALPATGVDARSPFADDLRNDHVDRGWSDSLPPQRLLAWPPRGCPAPAVPVGNRGGPRMRVGSRWAAPLNRGVSGCERSMNPRERRQARGLDMIVRPPARPEVPNWRIVSRGSPRRRLNQGFPVPLTRPTGPG